MVNRAEFIAGLVPVTEATNEDCSICIDNLTDPIVLSCKHVFCRGCITQWLAESSRSCPYCRTILFDDEQVPNGMTFVEAAALMDFDAEEFAAGLEDARDMGEVQAVIRDAFDHAQGYLTRAMPPRPGDVLTFDDRQVVFQGPVSMNVGVILDLLTISGVLPAIAEVRGLDFPYEEFQRNVNSLAVNLANLANLPSPEIYDVTEWPQVLHDLLLNEPVEREAYDEDADMNWTVLLEYLTFAAWLDSVEK